MLAFKGSGLVHALRFPGGAPIAEGEYLGSFDVGGLALAPRIETISHLAWDTGGERLVVELRGYRRPSRRRSPQWPGLARGMPVKVPT